MENVNAFFLEYDDERSWYLKRLAVFPKEKNKIVVLGLFTSKNGKLED
jgi:hypothetical protein